MRAVPKLPAKEGSGIQDEVKRIVELIDGDRQKDLPVLGPYRIEGEGRVIPVWVDGLGVRHSKKFYLKLIEDFLVQCKKPAGRGAGTLCTTVTCLNMLYTVHK